MTFQSASKTCARCGASFAPKFPNAKLCYACWKRRENAFTLVEQYERQIADLRERLLIAQNPPPPIPPDIARLLRVLVHPDKHGNSPAATKAFKWINEQLSIDRIP